MGQSSPARQHHRVAPGGRGCHARAPLTPRSHVNTSTTRFPQRKHTAFDRSSPSVVVIPYRSTKSSTIICETLRHDRHSNATVSPSSSTRRSVYRSRSSWPNARRGFVRELASSATSAASPLAGDRTCELGTNQERPSERTGRAAPPISACVAASGRAPFCERVPNGSSRTLVRPSDNRAADPTSRDTGRA